MGLLFAWGTDAPALNYYVNDPFTNGDIYCTAIGAATNTGTSAASPLNMLSQLLAVTNLAPGDVVYVDTGWYTNDTAVIGPTHSGVSGNPAVIIGSTNLAAGGSRFVYYSVYYGLMLDGVDYLDLKYLQIYGGYETVYLRNSSDNNTLESIQVFGSGYHAFRNAGGMSNKFIRCLVADSEGGFYADTRNGVVWDGGVMWNNKTAFKQTYDIPISNSVVVGGRAFDASGLGAGDFNVFWDTDIGYSSLIEMQKARDGWWHCIVAEPGFAGPATGNFWPRSVTGRFDPTTGNWVTDTVHSIMIDLGDPQADYTREPQPNGSNLNIGIWGNTSWASLSRTNVWLLALSFNDGGVLSGSNNPLYWRGGYLTNGATVSLQYSLNLGVTWSNIVQGLAATNQPYYWDVSSLPPTAAYWRVVSDSNTNVWDACDQRVSINGARVPYYVNDGYTNGDVYCSAIGNDLNPGVSPAAPKLTLTNMLAAYSFGSADAVFIDTGTNTGYQTLISGDDRGSSETQRFMMVGSTNQAAGGTVLDRGAAAESALKLNNADYVLVKDLNLIGGYQTLDLINGSDHNVFEQLVVAGAVYIGVRNTSGVSNRFFRCLVRNNPYGFTADQQNGLIWDRCISWSNSRAFYGLGFPISNSVIVGGYAFAGPGPAGGDHNVFWNTILHENISYLNFSDFQEAQDSWWHCMVADPGMANPAGGDYHPKSVMRRYDPATGNWVTDSVHSILIDFGDPLATYANEPEPNGARLNAGIFGNTGQASQSRTNAWLLALSYNDGGQLSVPTDYVYWNAGNLPGGARVRIEYSSDSTSNWFTLATGILASAGSYQWTNTAFQSSRYARWKVVYEGDTNAWDMNDNDFILRNGPYTYFINDTSTNGDVYCTAVGSDANPGRSAASPAYSLNYLLSNNVVAYGDIIYVDTGLYPYLADQVITAADSGNSNGHVNILGSTNSFAGGTVFSRVYAAPSTCALRFNGAGYIQVRNISFQQAGEGLAADGAHNLILEHIVARENSGNGLLLNNVSTNVRVLNSVFWNNTNAAIRVEADCWVAVTNSILVAHGPVAYGYWARSNGCIRGDYNDFFVQSNAVVGFVEQLNRNLDTPAAWAGETGQERHSLDVDPLFADPRAGNFHLQTATPNGRFVRWGVYTNDSETSVLIDSGDPLSDYVNEPADNGRRINIGLYGNTTEASRGRTNAWLRVAQPGSGGWVRGTGTLHWVAGQGATSHNVRVEFSPDGGETWSALITNTPAAAELFVWNTSVTNDTPAGLWRVASLADPSLGSTNATFFAVRNTNLNIYVNDAATNGDVYTTAIGSPGNWRATPACPLDSLASAVSAFDLEPGDRIFMDTGCYTATVNTVFMRADGGAEGAPLQVIGSTNDVYGGTRLRRGDASPGAYALQYTAVAHVTVSNLWLQEAASGIRADEARHLVFDRVRSISNASHAVDLAQSSNIIFSRSVLARNTGAGINGTAAAEVQLRQSVIWSNGGSAVLLNGGSLRATNSVLSAAGAVRYVYELSGAPSVMSDCNDILTYGEAGVARVAGVSQDMLIQWQTQTSNDVRSLSHEPLFADAAAFDFHPRSEAGRFVTGWPARTNDTETSPLIDTGNPLASYDLEPEPNGARINIGPHGNDFEASLSRTGAWFVALTLNSGGSIRGTNRLYWVAGGAATGHAVSVQFSTDNGLTWTNLATNVAVGTSSYNWNTLLLDTPPDLQWYWRVISDVDTNIWDATDKSFVINNGAVTYYVNDSFSYGDCYCTGPGSFTNNGVTPASPKASIMDVVNSFSLRPIDRILVDTGTYNHNGDILIADIVGGLTNRFLIQGSTNWAYGGTVLDFPAGTNGFRINGTEGVHLRDLMIARANIGLQINQSTNTLVERVMTRDGPIGFNVQSATNTEFRNCLARNHSGVGLYIGAGAGDTTWRNGIIWSNQIGVYMQNGAGQGALRVVDSVVAAFGAGRSAYYYSYLSGALQSDYNNIMARNGAYAGVWQSAADILICQTLSRWVRDVGLDAHSLSCDPMFFNPNSDYHLQTMAPTGRFVSGAGYVGTDAQTAPLIDAGDPSSSYTNEPPPNGGRVNIGLYGNSTEASRTPTNALLTALSLNDGGRVEGVFPLRWVALGDATGYTVNVEYSADSGSNWVWVATNLPAADGVCVWTSTLCQSSALGVWRVRAIEDPWVWGTNSVYFALRNEPLKFYVNDGSTNGDVYCTATGRVTNSGAVPGSPKDSIQAILDAYDLEAGDTVYVDTGLYGPTNSIVIGMFDEGDAADRIVFQGSTNLVAGGTVLTNYGFEINAADYITLRHFEVRRANTAYQCVSARESLLEWCVARMGGNGFVMSSVVSGRCVNCLAEGLSGMGLQNITGNSRWESGVIWSNATGISAESGVVGVENSVVGMYGAGHYAYSMGPSGVIQADYNAIYLQDGAFAGYRQTTPDPTYYVNVSRWARDYGQDRHSLSVDPAFGDVLSADYHLRTLAPSGRFVTGYGFITNDWDTSPLIDAGNPVSVWTNEPAPNGARINIGMYGNSGEASQTPTNAALTIYSLNDGGRAEGVVSLYWAAQGDATGYTVNVDYSFDGGASWSNIASGLAAAAGGCVWTSTLFQSSAIGSWRVQAVEDAAVVGSNRVYFALRNQPLRFYVNDYLTNGDVYCTTTGRVSHSGAFPSAPKDSVAGILDTYDLEPGDTIYIDTGWYYPTNTIRIGLFDEGQATNRVTLQGSTNLAAGGSIFHNYGLEINDADGVTLRHLTIQGASVGIYLYRANSCAAEFVRSMNCGLGFSVSDADNFEASQCAAVAAGTAGLYQGSGSSNTVWRNGVLWSNSYAVYALSGVSDPLTIENTVIGVFGVDHYAYFFQSGGVNLRADYNDIWLNQGAYAFYQPDTVVPIIKQTVSRWARDSTNDLHSLTHDPQFASLAGADYHPRTQAPAGRFVPGSGYVTNDLATSVLMDAGNPGSVWTNEPAPNGQRVNIGIFGNSTEASKTPTNASFTAVSLNDGGRIEGTNWIYWVARGAATGYMVRLQFSPDGGATWTNIATNIAAAAGGYFWNTTAFTSTIRGVWKIFSEANSNIFDQTDIPFAVRNAPLYFYVNDTVLDGDVYCSAIGATTNNGVTPASPKLSLQDLLDTYDLEPGDVVLVDTATFLVTAPVKFNWFDAGATTNRVTIQGSTNESYGGTVFTKFGGGYVFEIDRTHGIALRNLLVRNGSSDIRVNQSDYARFDWIRTERAPVGFDIYDSDQAELWHCLALGHSDKGVGARMSEKLRCQSSVLWSNRYGTYVENSSIMVENSVLGALAGGAFGHVLQSGSITSDYNSIYVSDGGMAAAVLGGGVGGGTTRYPSVSSWATARGQDLHTLAINPRFYNPLAGDFHLMSVNGRYQVGSGFVTNDTLTSSLIDAGRPTAAWALEPEPNGERINIGLYGNTTEESKTPTNGMLTTVSLHDGGSVSGLVVLTWMASGVATGHTVRIEFSNDGGLTFSSLVAGVSAALGSYNWTSAPYGDTALGLWRIASENDTNVFDVTDSFFYLRNSGSLKYYVNDSSTNGDVYTYNIGASTNRGVSPAAPKASVQDVVNTYDLEPGDVIYVDTGNYALTAEINIGDLDAGTASNRVVIQGSTNSVGGGTVFDRGGSGNGYHFYRTGGIDLRDVTVQNAVNGIYVNESPDCVFVRVISRNNSGHGFSIQKATAGFERCLALDNGGAGLLSSGGEFIFDRGVSWGNTYAVAGSGSISNSLLKAYGTNGVVFSMMPGGVVSDYNNVLVADGALVGIRPSGGAVGGVDIFDTLTSWVLQYGQDAHSLSHDPKLATAGSDFHLQSQSGRFVPGFGWTNDAVTSPMIDTGGPGSTWTNEPVPNGRRVNIGSDGNSSEASKSLLDPWILAVSFNDGGTLDGTVTVYWVSGNMLSTGDTVRLDYSLNSGVEWNTILSNVPVSAGSYRWNVSALPTTIRARWRVVSETSNATDAVDKDFIIRNEPQTYYVNDAFTNGDMYCTAPGNPTNSGRSAGAPLDSPVTLMQNYVVGAGDVIYIDTGYYSNTASFAFNSLSRGMSGMPIRVYGSTNYLYGGSVIDRASSNPASVGLEFYSTRYVEVEHLRVKGAGVGVALGACEQISLNWIEAFSNLTGGFTIGNVQPVVMRHCAAWNNGGPGLSMNAGQVTWDQGVFWSNWQGAISIAGGSLTVSNSILHAYGVSNQVYTVAQGGNIAGDFNLLCHTSPARLAFNTYNQTVYSKLIEWQRARGMDFHSIVGDPLFNAPAAGDFHVRSTQGHWGGTNWVSDAATSWAIDAGAFGAVWTNEPEPNGRRVNIGLYGNTDQASKTPTNPALLAVSIRDGGTVQGTQKLYWVSHGMATDRTVSVQYSIDAGETWTNIASGVPVNQDGYIWNTTNYQSTPLGRWRVVYDDDTNVMDATTANFFMRVGAVQFYVNDLSTNNDVYTWEVGSVSNVGLSPLTPMLSIQDVFNSYDVDGGDTIFVDTGYYPLTNGILITSLDAGTSSAYVRLLGSTSVVARTVIGRETPELIDNAAFSFNSLPFYEMAHFDIQSATNGGLNLRYCQGSHFNDIHIRDGGGAGVSLYESWDNEFNHCVITRIAGHGVVSVQSEANQFNNCVIWSNKNHAFSVAIGNINVSNSILHASGVSNLCFAVATNTSVYSDFNILHVVDGALYGVDLGLQPVEGIPQWTLARGQDMHSFDVDPLFADPTNNDFHVRSASGRFDPALRVYVTNDTEWSCAIDTADATAAFTNEPDPNGARLNIGRYGNTPEASKSRTNAWLFAITAMAGGRLENIFYLVWAWGGMDSTNTVRLDYSFNDGVAWTNIAFGVVVTNGQYLWDSAIQVGGTNKFISSPNARWRIQLDSDTNVQSMTRTFFALRNQPFVYYINDAYTNNDVYTTQIGSDTNFGLFPWSPKATLQGLLNSLDVEKGDTILVDTGVYPVTNTWGTITIADSGRDGQHIYLVGSTHAARSVLDRASEGSRMSILLLPGSYITISNFVLLGGDISLAGESISMMNLAFTNGGISAAGSGPGPTETDVQIRDVDCTGGGLILSAVRDSAVRRVNVRDAGISLGNCGGLLLENALVYGGTASAVFVSGNYSEDITVRNCTLAAGDSQFRQSGSAYSTLENSTLVATGPDKFCIRWEGGTVQSDYNNLVARSNAWIGLRNGQWEKLVYWQEESGQDAHSVSREPLFADEAGGDYHEFSTGGRWFGGTWVTDLVDSVVIDAGNPLSIWTNEPPPNGGRVNLGAYGNTDQASKTPAVPSLVTLTMNDGGVMRGTNWLRWLARNIGGNDLVNLEYSPDKGLTWSTIAAGVAATNQAYWWDSTPFLSSLTSLWRVVLQTNVSVYDETDNTFALRNTALNFYVNDTNTDGDCYTTAPGSPTNTGLTADSPLDSVSSVLAAYDVVGPDTIYVDTGFYLLTNNLQVIWSRRGDAGYGPLLIQGSTNYADRSSIFDRGFTNADVLDVRARYVSLRDLTVQGGNRGFLFSTNQHCTAERVFALSNRYGFVAQNCISPTMRNARFWDNNQGGVDISACQTAIVENCTLVGNKPFAFRYSVGSANGILQNNIFVVPTNSGAVALTGPISDIFVDYNVYYFLGAPQIYSGYADLLSWQLARQHDYRSNITNPLLASADTGDFHLQSTGGRWLDGAGWVYDSLDSWAIDKGNPTSPYDLEPPTNGFRINIGAYGNTEYASRSATNTIVFARTGNEALSVTSSPLPLIWTIRNVPTGLTFAVQYSGDGGDTWTNLATGIPNDQEYIIWNLSPFYNTFKGRWRIIGEGDPSYVDTNNMPMMIFFGEFAISSIFKSQRKYNIVWRGAWDENYLIEYSTNCYYWTNAPSGPGPNQTNDFISTYGGDMQYEDIESSNTWHRIYRVRRKE